MDFFLGVTYFFEGEKGYEPVFGKRVCMPLAGWLIF